MARKVQCPDCPGLKCDTAAQCAKCYRKYMRATGRGFAPIGYSTRNKESHAKHLRRAAIVVAHRKRTEEK